VGRRRPITTQLSDITRSCLSTDALAAQRRCHFGQPALPIAVTNHIDGFGGSHNDGITWLRGESGIRFGSQLITWSKY
jgi:hypothetical protein